MERKKWSSVETRIWLKGVMDLISIFLQRVTGSMAAQAQQHAKSSVYKRQSKSSGSRDLRVQASSSHTYSFPLEAPNPRWFVRVVIPDGQHFGQLAGSVYGGPKLSSQTFEGTQWHTYTNTHTQTHTHAHTHARTHTHSHAHSTAHTYAQT